MNTSNGQNDTLRIACPECQCRIELDPNEVPPFSMYTCPECEIQFPVPLPFGDFLLEQPLGKSHIFTVYRSIDLRLEREVVVKILTNEFSRDSKLKERFQDLARKCAALNAPNILFTYKTGEDGGQPYLVTEYMPQGSLQEKIDAAEGQLPVSEALEIASQISNALQQALEQADLAHDDLKPYNVLFSDSGNAKLSDFGMSRLASAASVKEKGAAGSVHPCYASPEFLTTDKQDYRGDIFSLGAVLYHMLSGRPPFIRDRADNVFSNSTPQFELVELRQDVSSALNAFVKKLLSFEPDARPQSYEEVKEQLKNLKTSGPSGKKERGVVSSGKETSASAVGNTGGGAKNRTLRSTGRSSRRSPRPAGAPSPKTKQRRAVEKALDRASLLCVLILIGLIGVSVKTKAPWYTTFVEPKLERVFGVEAAAQSAEESSQDTSEEAAGTNALSETSGASKVGTETEGSETRLRASHDLPRPQNTENRPRPPGLDFESVKPGVLEYVKSQPSKELRKLEQERVNRLATCRAHLVQLMKHISYGNNNTVVYLSNGETVTGKIPIANQGELCIREPGKPLRTYEWKELAFKQFSRFFNYYAEKRLEMATKEGRQLLGHTPEKDAARDHFLAALLCDWYGYPDVAKEHVRQALNLSSSVREDINRFLYYLK